MSNEPPVPTSAVVVEYEVAYADLVEQVRQGPHADTVRQSEAVARQTEVIERLARAVRDSDAPLVLTYTTA